MHAPSECFTLLFVFRVDKDSGAITMFKGVPEGNYTFEATVYDKVFDKIVTSTVTVYVKEISEQAVYNSGSIRFSGKGLRIGYDLLGGKGQRIGYDLLE